MVKTRILLIDQDTALAPILKLSIEAEIAHPFELANTGKAAFECIKEFDDIGLIIGSWSLSKKEQKELIFQNRKNKNIPLLMLSRESKSKFIKDIPDFFSNSKNLVIEYQNLAKEFAPAVRHILQDYTKNGEFQVVSFPLLLRFGCLGHEVFHHIQSEERYIALNQRFDHIDLPKILTFKSERQNLFMKTKQYKQYLDEIIEILLAKDNKNIEHAPLTSALLLEKYTACGLNPQNFHEGKKLLTYFMHSLKLHKEIISNLEWMKKVHDYRHLVSTLTLSLVLEVGKKLELDSDKYKEKMAYAALLQDISLNENFISFISKDEILYLDIEEKVKEMVLKHPILSAKMLADIPQIPSDTLKIIEQHHEMPDGTGYPRGLTYAHISAVSGIYITCYRLAHEMIKNINLQDKDLVLKIKSYLGLYFSNPKFNKYRDILLELFSVEDEH